MKELITEQLGFEHLPMLSEFVEKGIEYYSEYESLRYMMSTMNYRNFITQPLTKGMFVPCDEDGNVLEEPECKLVSENCCYCEGECVEESTLIKYQQALERVVFKGWSHILSERDFYNSILKKYIRDNETIEQAINAGVKFKLR